MPSRSACEFVEAVVHERDQLTAWNDEFQPAFPAQLPERVPIFESVRARFVLINETAASGGAARHYPTKVLFRLGKTADFHQIRVVLTVALTRRAASNAFSER